MRMIVRNEILYSDRAAIADDKGNIITYRQLAIEAKKLKHDIEERSLIFLLCDHNIETVKFLYEALYMNYVPLLLPGDINEELLNNLIKIYNPQYIYCHKSHEIVKHYRGKSRWEYHELLQTGKKKYKIHSDVAVLLSSSGTTGSAKLVKISYENLRDNVKYTCQHLEIQSNHKGISPLPLNYTYGFSFCLWHWYCGAKVLITEEPVISKKFCDFYAEQKIDHFAATPYTYQMLQKIQFWDYKKLKCLHWAMSGGAQLSEHDQVNLAANFKGKFLIGYGQTECTCMISATSFMEDHIRIGTVGKPFDNMNFSVKQETGELIVKSKSVCMGYAECKGHLEKGDVNGSVLHTGDVVYMDKDGYIYLKGRLTRYVKILGKRTSLDDVEKYLKDKWKDIDFASVGTDHEIFIFYSGVAKNLEKEISILLDKNMKIPKGMVHCQYLDMIPRNKSGKIMYAQLEKEVKNGETNTGNLQ